MSESSIHILIGSLIFLICLSAFFSAAEIGMMSLNRYRLRNLVRKKNRAARRVNELLARPDRLLGIILIGNNFANIGASAIATIIAAYYFGDIGVAIGTVLLTLVILIFAEITPKTLAALYPEQVAFSCSVPLKILLVVLYPLVWIINGISNGLLRIFNIDVRRGGLDTLSHEELRTIVREATGKGVSAYQEMLLRILDLEKITVNDIMIPRSDIMGIDIEDDWDKILKQLTVSQHTRIPVYRDTLDHMEGMLHLRKALNLLAEKRLNKRTLLGIVDEAYFVPSGTPLNIQLINFRRKKICSALVVDEYGDIEGLVTLEDILEEIVGEFTTDIAATRRSVVLQKDGSYLVSGNVSIRELNRSLNWELPVKRGTKTLSGVIVEYLETLPSTGVGLRLAGYPIEIVEVEENTVKTARIWPKLKTQTQ